MFKKGEKYLIVDNFTPGNGYIKHYLKLNAVVEILKVYNNQKVLVLGESKVDSDQMIPQEVSTDCLKPLFSSKKGFKDFAKRFL